MSAYLPLLEQPAFWGVAGAFIFAAPQWVACVVHCRQTREPGWTCSAEFVISLVTGAIAAGAFSKLAADLTPVKDPIPIAATLGLIANTTAPMLIKRLSALASARLGGKLTPPGAGE